MKGAHKHRAVREASMMEPRDALKNIRELAQVASESEDIELIFPQKSGQG
jgi:hypothetical protein